MDHAERTLTEEWLRLHRETRDTHDAIVVALRAQSDAEERLRALEANERQVEALLSRLNPDWKTRELLGEVERIHA